MVRRLPGHLAQEDLMGFGWVGLMEAHKRAAPGMDEEEFEAYALYRIRGAMQDHLRRLDPTPRRLRRVARQIQRQEATLRAELGRAATPAELADRMSMSTEQIDDTRRELSERSLARQQARSLDDLELAHADRSPEETAGRKQLERLTAEAVDKLPERLQGVLRMYYGEGMCFRSIGDVLGVTESRACQLHAQALRVLRAEFGEETDGDRGR
jgi:RNA polymerase sigma factor for flagellar operon FliA